MQISTPELLDGKQIFVTKYVQREEKEQSSGIKNPKWKNEEEALKNEESIAESGRIFIRNLPYTVTENDIQELFTKYGKGNFSSIVLNLTFSLYLQAH